MELIREGLDDNVLKLKYPAKYFIFGFEIVFCWMIIFHLFGWSGPVLGSDVNLCKLCNKMSNFEDAAMNTARSEAQPAATPGLG